VPDVGASPNPAAPLEPVEPAYEYTDTDDVPLDPEDTAQAKVPGQISLPGWDDVIHIVPDSALSRDDQIKRKMDRIRRIQGSQATGLSQAVTWAMTKIDDIQDGFVTLSVATRLLALAVPSLRPVGELFGKAADTLNLGTLFKAATKAPTATKRGLESRMKLSPGYYQGRVKGATSLMKALPNVAESLQILQTSDQLTGIGISLGAIMGAPLAAVSDLLSGPAPAKLMSWNELAALPEDQRRSRAATEAAAAEPEARNRFLAYGLATVVSVLQPATLAVSAATEIVGRYVEGITKAEESDLKAATDIMDAEAWVGGADHTFTPHEHLLFSLAHSLALAACTLDQRDIPTAALAPITLDRPFSPDAPRNETTRIALRTLGFNPDNPGPFPLRGNPTRVTLRDAIAEWTDSIPPAITSWRNALHTPDQISLAQILHTEQARAPWKILEGPNVEVENGYIPQGRAANALMAMGITLPPDFPDELVWDLLTDLGAKWFLVDHKHPRFDDAKHDLAQWIATNLTSTTRE